MKIASVVGNNVTASLIHQMYPYSVSADSVERDLEELEDAVLLEPLGHGVWNFVTVVVRDAVYAIIPHDQRRYLHAKLADSLQRASGSTVPMATIAQHWTKACRGVEAAEWKRTTRAIRCWEAAAHQAMDKGQRVEAIQMFEMAQELATCLDCFILSMRESGAEIVGALTMASASSTPPTPTHHRSTTQGTWSIRTTGTSSCGRGTADLQLQSAKRARWERNMAFLLLQLGVEEDCEGSQAHFDSAEAHILNGLHLLGAPGPGDAPHFTKKRQDNRLLRPLRKLQGIFGRYFSPSNEGWRLPRRRRPSMTGVVARSGSSDFFKDRKTHRRLSEEEILEGAMLVDMLVTIVSNYPQDDNRERYIRELIGFFSGGSPSDGSPFILIQRRLQQVADMPPKS